MNWHSDGFCLCFWTVNRYLEEKKKRKRLRGITYEPAPEREIIAFGDVVQGPPKLSFPPKAKVSILPTPYLELFQHTHNFHDFCGFWAIYS